MLRIFFTFLYFLIVSSVSFGFAPQFLLGVATDVAFGEKESILNDRYESGGAEEINNLQTSGSASSREFGIRFLSGFQFIRMLDVYLGLGGTSNLVSQAIGENRIVYTQQNIFSFELNTKGNWHLHKNVGFYALLGGGLDYIYLTSGGGSKKIDLGLYWNDFGGYIIIGLGSFLFVGETKKHRYSVGLQGKTVFRNNKDYSIDTNNTKKTLNIRQPGFLLGFHFEYMYLL